MPMRFYKMPTIQSDLEVFSNSKNEKRLLNKFFHLQFFLSCGQNACDILHVQISYTTSLSSEP